jgi:peptidoglycan L-alanyl-D-glutamate endopeptidase CwlK
MRDKITEQRIALLHPKLRYDATRILELAEAKFPKNMAIRVAQGLRTFEEQNALFAQGRTKPGKIVTKAKGGQSLHNYGLALDFLILHDKDNNGNYETASWDTILDFDKDGIIDWQEIVSEFEKAGWEWGGKWRTFKDLPHVQKVFGHTWQTLLAKYQKNDFIPGTKYVNI